MREQEIREMIDDICKRIDPNYNGEIYIRDKNHTPPNNWTRLSKETLAKALHQKFEEQADRYNRIGKLLVKAENKVEAHKQALIDARIEELEQQFLNIDAKSNQGIMLQEFVRERIAQLKKKD